MRNEKYIAIDGVIDTNSLIYSFIRLICLGALSKKVKFRRHFLIDLAAVKLISSLRPVIDLRRRLTLIVDDTLMSSSCSTKTGLLANVYDHNKKEYLTGYRGLNIGWSDGNLFMPANFALMSTKKAKNMIGKTPITQDRQSIAGSRRIQAQEQMNDVTVELIKQAINEGMPAEYCFI